jgi:uncharacterized protein (DUF885 family)
MKSKKNENLKKWIKRIFLLLFLLLLIWVVNLIWFKPFNIEHLYSRAFVKVMLKDPELVTTLDIPVLYGFTKSKLTDVSDEADLERLQILKDEFETLKRYNFDELSDEDQLNTRILSWYLNNKVEGESFLYQSYSFNHISSEAIGFPRLMQEYHKLESKSDIEAYLTRLEKFPSKLKQLIKKDSNRASKGALPPDFIIEKTIGVIENVLGISENASDIKSNILYSTFKNGITKIDDLSKDETSDYLNQAETIIKSAIIPAYKAYIKHLKKLKETATSGAGVWKLPNGDAYYRYCLKSQTTTNLEPETIYQIGLSEVDEIQKKLKEVVGQFVTLDSTLSMEKAIEMVAYKTNKVLYAPKTENDPSLKDQLLDYYIRTLKVADSMVTPSFNIKPKSKLVVKPTPAFLGSSAPNQYRYTNGEGVFYTNLTNIETNDSIFLTWHKSLSYHEGTPGHHFQIAIQRELKNVPMFRNVLSFSAYTEGWGLYAEWLTNEMGAYQNDPAGNAGRLSSELLRAVRLVVDTGIHYKRWTREEAITYMIQNLYINRESSEKEIDRYIVNPGQACAYKVGMLKILELRNTAEKALGSRFDLRKFHDVVLKNGALPLEVLEELVIKYIEKESQSIAQQ